MCINSVLSWIKKIETKLRNLSTFAFDLFKIIKQIYPIFGKKSKSEQTPNIVNTMDSNKNLENIQIDHPVDKTIFPPYWMIDVLMFGFSFALLITNMY